MVWALKLAGLFLAMAICISCAKQVASLDSQVEVITDDSLYQAIVMVVLPNGTGICTGTFISPRAVLTAAHCTLSAGTYRVVSNFGTFSTATVEKLGPGVLEDPNDISVLVFASEVATRSEGQVVPVGSQASVGETMRLIGFGCNNLDTRRGSGIKRTGTNRVVSVDDYISLLTSGFSVQAGRAAVDAARGILGPVDQAASCFGDSGGPLLRESGDYYSLVGVTHAGGSTDDLILSQYVDINRTENLEFLHSVDAEYSLGIFDNCDPEDRLAGSYCETHTASVQIVGMLKKFWAWCVALFAAR